MNEDNEDLSERQPAPQPGSHHLVVLCVRGQQYFVRASWWMDQMPKQIEGTRRTPRSRRAMIERLAKHFRREGGA